MLHDEAESSTSATRTDAQWDLPRYGAQHRQDARWTGGNKVLPPRWKSHTMLDGVPQYHDETLMMVSWNRPLPGVRLDKHGQLVPGCEWHISPRGRSYFVNHHTRTTSWKKPVLERPAGSLTPECIIKAHSMGIWSLAYLGTSCNIISTSEDGSIRQWKRAGNQLAVGKPLDGLGKIAISIAVCPDKTKVMSGSLDGRLRLWSIKEGTMVGDPLTWEGHNAPVGCLDWSPNALEIASGSDDGTIRRWNAHTGRQITLPINTGHGWVYAVKYSPQGDELASSGMDMIIRVWSKDGELLTQLMGHVNSVPSLCWSKHGTYIFSASLDKTVRKWQSIDGVELFVLRGHRSCVKSLCLSRDGLHLISASMDSSVRIWNVKMNQQVGDPLLHDDEVSVVAISPDGKHLASAGLDGKIYLWGLDAALKQQGGDQVGSAHGSSDAKPDAKLKMVDARAVSEQHANSRGPAKYGDDVWDARRSASPASPSSPFNLRSLLGSLFFSTQPANEPDSIALEPQCGISGLFLSSRTVDVAPARDEDRDDIAPESDEDAAAALRRILRAATMPVVQHNEINLPRGYKDVKDDQHSPETRIAEWEKHFMKE